ncbi:MAG TPA: histidine--tRNA ligase [Methylomirabilota bacterium]|jgi:histidyl-tRNA synthetase|nr:histidine--tRNA ligase [Methylomirabilota bacterium]
MRDVLPDEVALRDWAMTQIVAVYRRHGFVRIETPAVESLRLLLRSDGGENEKLIFKILKRGEKLSTAGHPDDLADLGLRFDLTVPLVRYYAQNHARLPQPLKAIQIGPVWRAERPQQGRYRQFTQCDIDILGVGAEVAEIELILATTEALTALGLKDLTVRLNDRRLLGALVAHCGFDVARAGSVFIGLDKLDKIGREGVAEELRAAGHPPSAIERLLDLLGSSVTPAALRTWLGPAADDVVWRALQRILETVEAQAAGRFRLAFDATLVRGMGYYTGPIFEIQHGDSTSSIAGGGRYDRMVGRFTGRDVPATGFSIGFERVVGILMERGPSAVADPERVALVFDEAMPALGPVLNLARDLREQGRHVLLETRAKRLGKQLQDLEARGFRRIGVVGPDGMIEWRAPRTGGAGETTQ